MKALQVYDPAMCWSTGVGNQSLAINGTFETQCSEDLTARVMQQRRVEALAKSAASIQSMPSFIVPLRPISKIDSAAETATYTKEVMAAQAAHMDDAGRSLLEEDLRSPCTAEIAEFRAFAREVGQRMNRHIVLDTAATVHTLLLLDTSAAYQREHERQARTSQPDEVLHLLARLRDHNFTRILLVTLPEATPVREAPPDTNSPPLDFTSFNLICHETHPAQPAHRSSRRDWAASNDRDRLHPALSAAADHIVLLQAWIIAGADWPEKESTNESRDRVIKP